MNVKVGRRRSRQEWEQLIEEWRDSGSSAVGFCRHRKISPRTFAWWRWKLGAELRGEGAPPDFVEVKVLPAPPAPHAAVPVFDVLVAGLVVRVPEGYDEEALVRLVSTLERRPC